MPSLETERRLAALPTAPIAAGGLIAGFGVAVATGSRPLGGVVLAACGLTCLAVWRRRDSARTAAGLTVTGLAAFALSHVLGNRHRGVAGGVHRLRADRRGVLALV